MITAPAIYLWIILALVLLLLGFYLNIWFLSVIAGIFLMVLGVYIAGNGIDGFNNLVTKSIWVIFVGLGGYIAVKSSLDVIEANFRR